MRLLTKAEACRELGLSLSTLDRRIAAGELQAKREPRGRRHRVYVILDDDPPDIEADESGALALAAAQERVRGLEGQLAYLQGQMEQERRRSAELLNNLQAGGFSPERTKRRLRWWWRN